MKRAVAIVVGTILIGLMLTGCATTKSLKPEVDINTTDIEKIKSVIINEFKNVGFKVVSESYNSIVLEGERLGSTSSDTMHAIINMATTGDSTRLIAQAYHKSDASFGREQYVGDITFGTTLAELERILERIKVQVESQ